MFAALDSTMPVEFPEDEDEGESEDEESKDVKPSTELLNVLTLQCKVAEKYEFAAKSAEACALLYEAATHNVQIQRAVMKKHRSYFPLAFAGVSHYVTGNLKAAAREIRKELLAEIRKCAEVLVLCARRDAKYPTEQDPQNAFTHNFSLTRRRSGPCTGGLFWLCELHYCITGVERGG